jgi:hypothetical protein
MNEFTDWIGVWTGGDRLTSHRVEFDTVQDGSALRMHAEAVDAGARKLRHGMRAVLAAGPHGGLRAAAYSTLHDTLLLDRMPDDEGVLALAGIAESGASVFVTVMQESEGVLLYTSYSRPAQGPESPRITARLTRLR